MVIFDNNDAVKARDAGELDRSLELYLQAMELFQQIDDRVVAGQGGHRAGGVSPPIPDGCVRARIQEAREMGDLRENADYDAAKRFEVADIATQEPEICRSGEVLQGLIKPNECAAFGKECTPRKPLGATMVSSEGACAAYFTYGRLAELEAAAAKAKEAGVAAPLSFGKKSWVNIENYSAWHNLATGTLENGFAGLGTECPANCSLTS